MKRNKLFEGTSRKALRYMLKHHRKLLEEATPGSKKYYVHKSIIVFIEYCQICEVWPSR